LGTLRHNHITPDAGTSYQSSGRKKKPNANNDDKVHAVPKATKTGAHHSNHDDNDAHTPHKATNFNTLLHHPGGKEKKTGYTSKRRRHRERWR
jgi:hypothetical protein